MDPEPDDLCLLMTTYKINPNFSINDGAIHHQLSAYGPHERKQPITSMLTGVLVQLYYDDADFGSCEPESPSFLSDQHKWVYAKSDGVRNHSMNFTGHSLGAQYHILRNAVDLSITTSCRIYTSQVFTFSWPDVVHELERARR